MPPLRKPVNGCVAEARKADGDERSDESTCKADDRGFGDEDQQHVAAARAQSLQDADLLRPLEHRRVHRVGDPETGEQQGDQRQSEQRDTHLSEQVLEVAELVAEGLSLEAERDYAIPQSVDRAACISKQSDACELAPAQPLAWASAVQ